MSVLIIVAASLYFSSHCKHDCEVSILWYNLQNSQPKLNVLVFEIWMTTHWCDKQKLYSICTEAMVFFSNFSIWRVSVYETVNNQQQMIAAVEQQFGSSGQVTECTDWIYCIRRQQTTSGGSSQNTLGGGERRVGVSSVAIISSRWKNWGPGQKVRGPRPPGPGLEPPLQTTWYHTYSVL